MHTGVIFANVICGKLLSKNRRKMPILPGCGKQGWETIVRAAPSGQAKLQLPKLHPTYIAPPTNRFLGVAPSVGEAGSAGSAEIRHAGSRIRA
jgi:hypothetical protein